MNPLDEDIRKIFSEPVQLGGDKVTLPGIEVAVMAAIRKEKKRVIKQLQKRSFPISEVNPALSHDDANIGSRLVDMDEAIAIVEGER